VKAKRVRKLDPRKTLVENAARVVRVRLTEMRTLADQALDPTAVKAQHDTRIAAKRLRYALEVTEFCFGRSAKDARRRARDLQDILGDLHDCDEMLPLVQRHLEELRASDAAEVRKLAADAADVEPALAARAPHRTSYRGLEILSVHLEARRRLLHDRFRSFWAEQERRGTWRRLQRTAKHRRREARDRRRADSLRAVKTEAAPRSDPAGERELGRRFVDALGYATEAHAGQLRGGDGQPYIAHLLRVAGLVIQEDGSEDEAIAALLHDAVEDQGGLERLKDIRARFGDVVADIVDECTDSYGTPKRPWRERKEQYLAELERASPGAVLVSLADKLDNVRTMFRGLHLHGDTVWERSGKTPEDARWYYGTLATRFPRLRPGPLADELASVVAQLEREIGGRSARSSPEHAAAAPRTPG
jgi:hypothetical protein